MLKQQIVLWMLLCCASIVGAAEQNILEAVESSARTWLKLNDQGRYAESWKNASPHFQQNMSEADWLKKAGAIRKPLGQVGDRYIATASQANKLSELPEGDYVILQFYTTFENQPLALETVTLANERDSIWRVADYTIK